MRNTQLASSPSAPQSHVIQAFPPGGRPAPSDLSLFHLARAPPGTRPPPHTHIHTQAQAGQAVSYRFQLSQAAHQSPT